MSKRLQQKHLWVFDGFPPNSRAPISVGLIGAAPHEHRYKRFVSLFQVLVQAFLQTVEGHTKILKIPIKFQRKKDPKLVIKIRFRSNKGQRVYSAMKIVNNSRLKKFKKKLAKDGSRKYQIEIQVGKQRIAHGAF